MRLFVANVVITRFFVANVAITHFLGCNFTQNFGRKVAKIDIIFDSLDITFKTKFSHRH